jgi:microcystin-dependent protein
MAILGEIRAFASKLPQGWLPCDGRHVEVSQHQALFALLGHTYGGSGSETFALPDLRGRVPAGAEAKLDQSVGSTSGLVGDNASLIPFAVGRWGIAVVGSFPERS